jgi:hypothetical protein
MLGWLKIKTIKVKMLTAALLAISLGLTGVVCFAGSQEISSEMYMAIKPFCAPNDEITQECRVAMEDGKVTANELKELIEMRKEKTLELKK